MSPALDAVAGKDLVELVARSAARRGARQPKPLSDGVHDAGVLGHREVRAERQLLEHAADAVRLRRRDVE